MINTNWYMHTMECYSVVKMKELLIIGENLDETARIMLVKKKGQSQKVSTIYSICIIIKGENILEMENWLVIARG